MIEVAAIGVPAGLYLFFGLCALLRGMQRSRRTPTVAAAVFIIFLWPLLGATK